MNPPPWPPSELVRLAWAARRDVAARQHLLQALQEGADFDSPLSSSDLNNDPFAVPGDCVAGVVVRELTGAKDAEEWLHAFLRAHELHQALPPAVGSAGKQRF
ncbi:hypothetical protein I5V52_03565 [Stenotrophomonas maltophilia]|uniref:hypothetical protein n=1 Tax=Stenotrophomonas maltophilia TaxID=40324 RepID=UPI0011B901D4|nr:hypothetical protein [Stenotrophomonas maltophilia]EKT4084538.1 hypothetical protein [Stenotrophomonas maltophilia]MBH1543268.1 hypothetical protein [Stenotrophomonas maltophilia]MBH1757898.1 hypothetical protein [Stenotrophomonas maltophilia]MBH1762015.1 hypothetical protein [Stenotrophomonas maltophilia]MBH1771214.1 hypothetical protein [Stenotrophomonas maltophilia]